MNVRDRGTLTWQLRWRGVIGFALVLAGLTCVTFSRAAAAQVTQSQIHDLKMLSLHDRLTLPDSTKVMIRGKVFTLGTLRQNHAALVASRNRVRGIQLASLRSLAGADYSITKTFAGKFYAMSRPVAYHPSPAATSHPVGQSGTYHSIGVSHVGPIGLITPTPMPPNLPLIAPSNGVPYPTDYRQFCSSLPATVCLYYPPGVTWFWQDQYGNYQTVDPLITDKGVCSQEGGQLGTVTDYVSYYGCVYAYPSSQTINFLPPAHGFSTSGWCDTNAGYFGTTTDSHGAVYIHDAGAAGFSYGWGYVSGGPGSEQFCFLQVKLAQ